MFTDVSTIASGTQTSAVGGGQSTMSPFKSRPLLSSTPLKHASMPQKVIEDETFLDSSTFVSTAQTELSTSEYEPSLDDTPVG